MENRHLDLSNDRLSVLSFKDDDRWENQKQYYLPVVEIIMLWSMEKNYLISQLEMI